MPYGRAICAGFMILGHLIFVGSIPVEEPPEDVSKSEQEYKPGVDLRSLHFPTEYHATGVLSLPTSNINEPFEVWHSQTYDKSRIDYYRGKINTLTLSGYNDVFVIQSYNYALIVIIPLRY